VNDKIDLSILQFVEAWRLMCTAAPGCELHSAAGAEYIFSGVPIPFFNVAVLTGRGVSGEELRSQGQRAREWAETRGVPWLLVVTHEALAVGTDGAAELDGCGYAPLMPLTGMLAGKVGPAARVPDGLELRVPQDDAGCEAVLDVNSAAYGMPLDAGKPVWGRRTYWNGHFPVLGLAGGEPVSSAVVMMVEGYRYVALVATAPGQQRRGYADAVMRHALEMSRQACGECPTFLHASDAGKPVYERMGYETVSTHTIFMDKRFLEGH